MSRYKAYSEYRDSGVENLGTIPGNWEVMQLKRAVLDCVNGIWGNEPENDGSDTIVIRVADFDRPKLSIVGDGYTYRKIDSKEKRSRVVARGDLLLEKSGGGEKTLVGQVVLFDKDFEAVTSNFVAKMTPGPNFSSSYLNYVFCRFYSSNINYCSIKQNTGIQNLDSASYLSEKFGFPPLHEQETIADFLDHETAKIDALIEKQQRLIELLKEKRQAVISHTVTKGLNPNAPMKDSGVEWLGQVPAHWNMQKLAWRFIAKKGANAAQLTKEFCASIAGDHPVFSGQTENSGVMACIDSYEFDAGEEGYLFSTTVGAKAMTVMHITAKFSLSQNCMVIIPCTAFSIPRFYFYHFQPLFSYERGLIPEHMQASFRMEDLYQYKVLEPPMAEQIEIANILDAKTAAFDELIAKSINACLLLQERRTALISAAVTGKIDVRDWQPAAAQEPVGVAC